SSDDVIGADQLGLADIAPEPAPRSESVSLDDALREHLVEVLTQTGWNISRTAALLGISRNTLRARMDKYRLRERESAPKAYARPRAGSPAAPAASAREPRPAAGPAPVTGHRWER